MASSSACLVGLVGTIQGAASLEMASCERDSRQSAVVSAIHEAGDEITEALQDFLSRLFAPQRQASFDAEDYYFREHTTTSSE